jgi:hypothetical protein
LDDKGDVLIENNEISIVVGESLTQQKVATVLKTALREWLFDWEQGIDRDNLLGKNTNEELARYEIERGLLQVDSTFTITEFAYEVDRATRTAKITFKAQTENGEEVGGEYTWD